MEKTHKQKPNRRWGCLLIVVCALLALCIAVLVVCASFSTIANALVQRELQHRGAKEVEVTVQKFSPTAVVLGTVRVGETPRSMTADSIRLNYRLSELLGRKLKSVEIIGLKIHVEAAETGYHIAGLDALSELTEGSSREDSSAAAPVVIERLILTNAQIIVHVPDQGVRKILVSGHGSFDDERGFQGVIEAGFGDAALTLHASGNLPSEEGEGLHVAGAATVQPGSLLPLPRWFKIGKIPSRFSFDATFGSRPDRTWTAAFRSDPEYQPLDLVTDPVAVGGNISFSIDAWGSTDAVRVEFQTAAQDVRVDVPDGHVSFGTVRFTGYANMPSRTAQDAEGEPPHVQVDGQLSAREGRGAYGTMAQLSGMSLQIPFRWAAVSGFSGPDSGDAPFTWMPGQISVSGFQLVPTSAECEWTADGLLFAAQFREETVGADVKLRQRITLRSEPKLATRVEMPAVHVGPTHDWYRRVVPLKGLKIEGKGGAAAEMTIDGDGIAGQVTAELDGTDITLSERSAIRNVRGRLWVNLPRFDMPLHQELQFDGGMAAGVPFGSGYVQMTLEAANRLFLEKAQVQWCGGLLRTYALQLNFDEPTFDAIVYAENVELDQVLSLVKGFNGTAQGTLYGQLPLSIEKGNVSYEKGFLYNVPGRTGILKLDDVKFLTRGVAGTHESYGNLQLAEKALQNFEFSLFKLDFAGQGAADTRLTIQLAGSSRADESLPPIDLTVNVRGALDEYINLGLGIRQVQGAFE